MSYAWTCHVCGGSVQASLQACPACEAPLFVAVDGGDMSGLLLNGCLAYVLGYWIGWLRLRR